MIGLCPVRRRGLALHRRAAPHSDARALPCTAVSYVAAALIGHYVFGEALRRQKMAAIGLICGGVVVLAFA